MIEFYNHVLCSILESHNPIVCYCDENYIQYKENILFIANNIINDFENIEFIANAIKCELSKLLDHQIFCNLTKCLYLSSIPKNLKIALSIGDYNILISTKEIKKYPLKEYWIQDLCRGPWNMGVEYDNIKNIDIEDNDRKIIQKAFHNQNNVIDMPCIKFIKTKSEKCLVFQRINISGSSFGYCVLSLREYYLKINEIFVEFSLLSM